MKRKILNSLIFLVIALILFRVYYVYGDWLEYSTLHYLKESYIPSYKYLFFDHSNSYLNNSNGSANLVPVLLYHGIVTESDGYNVNLTSFREHMFALKTAGWKTITLSEFEEFITRGKPVPSKSFLLTFDDGRKDSYYPVDPILKALNYTAATFIITGVSLDEAEQRQHYQLNIKELHGMVDSGRWELGAHAKNGHVFINTTREGAQGSFYSNILWLESEQRNETYEEYRKRVYQDMSEAKDELEQEFKIGITSFAYPFDEYGQRSISNVEYSRQVVSSSVTSLYNLAFYQVEAGNSFTYNRAFEQQNFLKRIEPRFNWTSKDLIFSLEQGYEKLLPYDVDVVGYTGWVSSQGILSPDNQSIILNTTPFQANSVSFLDGSSLWQNYTYSVRVKKFSGESFSLIAGYQSTDEYIACTYSNNSVRINDRNILSSEVLNRSTLPLNLSGSKFSLQTSNDLIRCFVNGRLVLQAKIERPLIGGVGLSLWSPQKSGNLEVTSIKSVNSGGRDNL